MYPGAIVSIPRAAVKRRHQEQIRKWQYHERDLCLNGNSLKSEQAPKRDVVTVVGTGGTFSVQVKGPRRSEKRGRPLASEPPDPSFGLVSHIVRCVRTAACDWPDAPQSTCT